jgi:hypothetical protein
MVKLNTQKIRACGRKEETMTGGNLDARMGIGIEQEMPVIKISQ